MSMNQYMHPRNIYKQPPNFKQLALEYPEFRKYVKTDISGKVTVDFKNVEALRALTYTLLKKDFNLDLEIPLNKLIPTVPLRLNYILWLEDLLEIAEVKENVKGIDIGTGASCIYPLLGAKKNNWAFRATEIDRESIKIAEMNVAKNNLGHLIKIIEIKNPDLLLGEIVDEVYDFCMCNPPFFGSAQELQPQFKARRVDRPRPKNAFCASVDEVVVKGGEVDYITKLIKESSDLKERIKIYTTMIGHKSSLPLLKKQLRDVGVLSFKQTEFCQGHTTRWGLAWTFRDIDLRKIPDGLLTLKQQQHAKPLFYGIEGEHKIGEVVERLSNVLKELQIEIELFKQTHSFAEFIVIARSNTWSHQRRRRRELKRLATEDNKEKNMNLNSSGSSKSSEDSGDELHKKMSEITVENSKKREWDDDMDSYYLVTTKKMRINYDNGEIYLKSRITVNKLDNVVLEFNFIEGNAGKEAMHQVLQYLKNNLCVSRDKGTNELV